MEYSWPNAAPLAAAVNGPFEFPIVTNDDILDINCFDLLSLGLAIASLIISGFAKIFSISVKRPLGLLLAKAETEMFTLFRWAWFKTRNRNFGHLENELDEFLEVCVSVFFQVLF